MKHYQITIEVREVMIPSYDDGGGLDAFDFEDECVSYVTETTSKTQHMISDADVIAIIKMDITLEDLFIQAEAELHELLARAADEQDDDLPF